MVSSSSSPATTIERGSKIGRFVVVTELGRGGMGAVYAAHDPQLDRQVALKVMRDVTGDEEDRVRMLREGQAMARVTHPNVITVYEVGTENGIVFLAQELLDAGTLGSWLDTPHPHTAILDRFLAAGRGLAAAHAAGLVHRDFKPDNVLLGKDGRVRVADFGLARSALALADPALAMTAKGGGPRDVPVANVDMTRSPMSPLTRTGAVMGTPMFMAPEQHKGERADARSDQFAFCVSLYQALYKAWPYEGKTAPALADAVIEGRLAPIPKNASVSPALRKILLRGLATDPDARYPSMEALLADLEREARPAQRSRMPWLVAGALVVVLGGAAGVYAVMQSRTSNPKPPPVAPPVSTPSNVVDSDLMTSEKGIVWLSTAIDRGQFMDTLEKFDLRASNPNRTPIQAAIDGAAIAYLRTLRGDLKEADAAIAAATKDAGSDPIATAYLDLAESALALARAQLPAARQRSERCAKQLASAAPVLAAICHQVHGEAQASLGEYSAARAAYQAGLALAAQATSAERKSTLQLALAQLDLDEQKTSSATELATQVLADCNDRNAVGCNVQARILLARIRRAEGSDADALDLLTTVKPASIEAFPVTIAHEIALGEILGYRKEALEDGKAGLDRIESARAQAEVRGFTLLMLDAKLARVRVLLTTGQEDPRAEVDALVQQARAARVERVARLAEAAFAELSEPAEPTRDMLPADGGLPAVRTGSSGSGTGSDPDGVDAP